MLKEKSRRIVICGAGIAGISLAYHLAVKHDITNIWLVDERPPLSLSGIGQYHATFADAECRQVANRAIQLLESWASDSGDAFHLRRNGVLYITARQEQLDQWRREWGDLEADGAGDLRQTSAGAAYAPAMPATPRAFGSLPGGADLIDDPDILRRHFPYLNKKARGGLHVRRAGLFSGKALGNWLLDQALANGVRLMRDRLEGVGGADKPTKTLFFASGKRFDAQAIILAAGGYLRHAGRLLGVDLPLTSQLQLGLTLSPNSGSFPNIAPRLVWADRIKLPWTAITWSQMPAAAQIPELLAEMPGGVIVQPINKQWLIRWDFERYHFAHPITPPPYPPYYHAALRQGLKEMIPAAPITLEMTHNAPIVASYPVEAPDKRPVVGAIAINGTYLLGGFGELGWMGAIVGGELLSNEIAVDHIVPEPFQPARLQTHVG